MKKLLLAILCLCCFVPTQAEAFENFGIYITPKFIYNYATTDFEVVEGTNLPKEFDKHADSLYGGALAVGYNFQNLLGFPVRAELEYAIFSQFEDKKMLGSEYLTGKLDFQTFFVNVYFDFRNSSRFTPYIGGGLGMALVGSEVNTNATGVELALGKLTETNFAWNVGLGVSYTFTGLISLDLGYRYSQFGEGKTATNSTNIFSDTDDVDSHQAVVGLRFTF